MKKLFIKFVIMSVLLEIFFFYISEVSSFAQPYINFNKIYYDFGEVKKTNSLTHIFEFENIGNAILIINKIKSDWNMYMIILKYLLNILIWQINNYINI